MDSNEEGTKAHEITKARLELHDEVQQVAPKRKLGGSAGLLATITRTAAFAAGAFSSRVGPVYNPFPSLGQKVATKREKSEYAAKASQRRYKERMRIKMAMQANVYSKYGKGNPAGSKLARMAREGRFCGGKGPGSIGA